MVVEVEEALRCSPVIEVRDGFTRYSEAAVQRITNTMFDRVRDWRKKQPRETVEKVKINQRGSTKRKVEPTGSAGVSSAGSESPKRKSTEKRKMEGSLENALSRATEELKKQNVREMARDKEFESLKQQLEREKITVKETEHTYSVRMKILEKEIRAIRKRETKLERENTHLKLEVEELEERLRSRGADDSRDDSSDDGVKSDSSDDEGVKSDSSDSSDDERVKS